MKRAFFIGFILFSMGLECVKAQHTVPENDTSGKKQTASTLLESFQRGKYGGSFRTFFMATDNAKQLSDYHALAVGGSLHFSSAPFHGFSFGIGGVYDFNLLSSDLSAKDSLTGVGNRYEIGLFDVENPKNKNDLDRMEEFWLLYQHRKIRLTLGHQRIQTPFVNFQDGRMRPTAVSGIWTEIEARKNIKIEGGWIWRISPRSTVRWYGVGESIGVYPKGFNPDGTASGYPEQLKSNGIGILGIKHSVGKNLKIQVWDQFVENIFNTAFVQADHSLPFKNGHKLLTGIQLMRQDAVANGGNDDSRKSYFQKGGSSNALSTQMGWERNNWQVLAAFTRITADGRFLTPREWGREPFYTFMARERVEGSGDVNAITGTLNWHNTSKNLKIGIGYGHFYLPDVKNLLLNKYAFPSYRQVNFDTRYTFGGALKGLRAQFLYVWKGRIGNTYGNDRYVINRVNMSNYNLVLNYIF